ncbi:MAG: hypothetical protein J5965_16820 [Aeriscardovia sp.]|nr:hypothetical protein [Aeriscardovia sp.]
MIEESKIDLNDPNVDLEEWATQFAEDFQKYCEEEKKRREDNGLILCLIYEDENYFLLDEFKASFELRKEDLKDYVYVDNNSLNFSCESGYEDYYLNRTYKFIRMDRDCAIFYRNY